MDIPDYPPDFDTDDAYRGLVECDACHAQPGHAPGSTERQKVGVTTTRGTTWHWTDCPRRLALDKAMEENAAIRTLHEAWSTRVLDRARTGLDADGGAAAQAAAALVELIDLHQGREDRGFIQCKDFAKILARHLLAPGSEPEPPTYKELPLP